MHKWGMHGKEDIKTLAALFDRDHERMLRLLVAVAQLYSKGADTAAAKVYWEFRHLQKHHHAGEEAALKHLVNEGACAPDVAARIFHEHELLKHLAEDTWRLYNQPDRTPFGAAITNLLRAVTGHERTERDELLPELCARIGSRVQLERTIQSLVEPPESGLWQ